MRESTGRKVAAVINTERCDYVVNDIIAVGFEVSVTARFEGHHSEDTFVAGPYKRLENAIEMVARHEAKLSREALNAYRASLSS